MVKSSPLKSGLFITLLFASFGSVQADDLLSDASGPFRAAPDFDATVRQYLEGGQPKVVGGQPAQNGEFPWQVSLAVSWIADHTKAHFCGGSIFNKSWIITAAHCVQNLRATDINVVYGTNLLVTGSKRVNVQQIIVNKNYNNPQAYDNDIALIQVKEPLVFDEKTTTIDLLPVAAQDSVLRDGSSFVVTGWGATQEGGKAVQQLRKVTVPFVTQEQCTDPLSYGSKVTSNMLCAGKTGADSCQGDSGGPLIYQSNLKVFLTGVVSWGEGCAKAGKYGVYTKMSNYLGWVADCVKGAASC